MAKISTLKVFKKKEERDELANKKAKEGYKVYKCGQLTVGDTVIKGYIAIY